MKKAYKTQAAYVAAIIKNELKAKFPGTKFAVHSTSYAGGNNVRVAYHHAPNTPDTKEIQGVVEKFQSGHFDGMNDTYEYTNKTSGPTVMYVFVERTYPIAVHQAVEARVPRGSWPKVYQKAYAEVMAEMYA